MIEQFLTCCSPNLSVFLKERALKRLDDYAECADQFLEAQGFNNLSKTKENPHKMDGGEKQAMAGDIPKMLRCFLCNRVGHHARDCRFGGDNSKKQVFCEHCERKGHRTEDCRLRNKGQAACVVPMKKVVPRMIDLDKKAPDNGTGKDNKNRDSTQQRDETPYLPVVYGVLYGTQVRVLRDSGTNIALVRRSLVREEDMTGETPSVILVDSTVRCLPEAKIQV